MQCVNSTDWPLIIATAVGGGGALWILQLLITWIIRPKLVLEFEDDREFFTTSPTGLPTIQAFYIRIKVKNTGCKIAKSCRAYMTNIETKTPNGMHNKIVGQDCLPLPWSLRTIPNTHPFEATNPIDLPKGVNQFIDICCTDSTKQNMLANCTPVFPFRFSSVWNQVGRFSLEIIVSADDGAYKKKKVYFEWDGTWNGFKFLRKF